MKKRPLGASGLEIAPLMLGGNVFGDKVDQAGADTLLDLFTDSGFNAVDTADVYVAFLPDKTGGESEEIIGGWFGKGGGRRQKVVLATKVGLLKARPGLKKENILAAFDDSLRRLKTDYVDIYFAHRDDPNTPLEETMAAFDSLVKSGKVRSLGASNYAAPRLAEALKAGGSGARFTSLQPNYSLVARKEFEAELQPLCEKEKIGVTPYWSLAGGFLTGKYRTKEDTRGAWRGQMARQWLNDAGLGVVAALDAVAERHESTPARVALAWLMARPTVTAPITSARTPEQLKDLLASAELKLSAEDVAQLDRASASF
jgi:aryl-alcohol dehydrogenase-like predicted oxidoreductase